MKNSMEGSLTCLLEGMVGRLDLNMSSTTVCLESDGVPGTGRKIQQTGCMPTTIMLAQRDPHPFPGLERYICGVLTSCSRLMTPWQGFPMITQWSSHPSPCRRCRTLVPHRRCCSCGGGTGFLVQFREPAPRSFPATSASCGSPLKVELSNVQVLLASSDLSLCTHFLVQLQERTPHSLPAKSASCGSPPQPKIWIVQDLSAVALMIMHSHQV